VISINRGPLNKLRANVNLGEIDKEQPHRIPMLAQHEEEKGQRKKM
jgi:hypothetical protein